MPLALVPHHSFGFLLGLENLVGGDAVEDDVEDQNAADRNVHVDELGFFVLQPARQGFDPQLVLFFDER